ncbi:exported hypothetical protein [Magnetospirillum molischianum DSM 120]|uniref:Uncharacterized protein n=1 Tax=Magnetospirillum molischianum DSM 120 TaxID=1150626 RepID=H8FPI1_MAGML|nr:exported hypothetical protein [Magnetospirillum molischianum DSM 120]
MSDQGWKGGGIISAPFSVSTLCLTSLVAYAYSVVPLDAAALFTANLIVTNNRKQEDLHAHLHPAGSRYGLRH